MRDRQAYLASSLRRAVSSGSPPIVVVVMFCLSLVNRGSRSLIFSLTSSDSCDCMCQSCETAIPSLNTS